MKYVDISKTIYAGMPKYHSDPDIKISQYKSLKRGNSCNLSHLSFGTHTGTHIDAPLHLLKGGKGISDVKLSNLISNVLLTNIHDFFTKGSSKRISRDNIRGVLFKSSVKDKAGITLEQAKELMKMGIKTVGTERMSIEDSSDRSHPVHRALLKKSIVIIEGLNLKRVKPGRYKLICLPLKIKDVDGAPARAILMYD